ncbi:outer membrane beta-barrel protein [Nitrospira sp. BLG_2]|uniref:outer membrane beta-barrel protein n=1 Tax=Nitrospira sp. BLG_2 TaxID=3397507 RepID=UPI003B9B5703
MRTQTFRACIVGLVFTVGVALFPLFNGALAEEFGGTEPGKWIVGFRAGFSPLTQQLSENTSTSVGPLVNFQGLYSVNTWLLVGMMLEWERHGVGLEQPDSDLGHQDTVSVLPTIEVRPVKWDRITPYVNMSFGVNVNSFGEDTALRVSPSNTFAWRLGWGADYRLNERFALNAEWAYKRNDGHATINGLRNDDWNASSFGFLFGGKMFF